jgi:AraC-like DNA-binding protein
MKELGILGMSHVLFGIVLIFSKHKQRADRVLLCWLAILLMPFLQSFVSDSGFSGIWFRRFVNQAFTLLHGPFLYLYIRELTSMDGKHPRYWPHFVLFFLFYVFLALFHAPLQPGGPEDPGFSGFFLFRHYGLITVISFLCYAAFSLDVLVSHREEIQKTYAYKNGSVTLSWLFLLPLLFVSLLAIILVVENSPLHDLVQIDRLHLYMFLFFTLYLVFFGIRQKNVYPSARTLPAEQKKTGEASGDQSEVLEEIDRKMAEQKLYRNPTLSVYDLARELGISRHQVSSLLNDSLSMNFYQYVNRFRLEEVCRRLQEDTENRYNILELAMESGFNSKSSFNSLFKKEYGQTPSQYKKAFQAKKGANS